MDIEAPSPNITNNKTHTYAIKSELDEEKKKIILTCQIISSLCPFHYQSSFTINDFIKINKIFKIYDNINEINSFINENIQKNKILIEKGSNDNNIKIIFNVFNLKGIEEKCEIMIEKKESNTTEIIKGLTNHINNLIIENRNLKEELSKTKDELNCLKNIINHKMDSLIINDENEQIFIEKRLRQIKLFSGKKFISRLLFRASINGDSADAFHRICDYKNNLLFLIKTKKNFRFGGFTTNYIASKYHDKCVRDDNAFCFSLNLKKIYNIKYNEAIYINKEEIITFLMDIFKIMNNFFSTESICTDAREGKKYIYYDNQKDEYEINGGEKTFLVQELEVFEIIYI